MTLDIIEFINTVHVSSETKQSALDLVHQKRVHDAIDFVFAALTDEPSKVGAAITLYRVTKGELYEPLLHFFSSTITEPDLKIYILKAVYDAKDKRFASSLINLLSLLLQPSSQILPSDYKLTLNLISSIGVVAGDACTPVLLTYIQSGQTIYIPEVFAALARIQSDQSVQLLVDLVGTSLTLKPHSIQRDALFTTLITIGEPAVKPLLDILELDNRPDRRRDAQEILSRIEYKTDTLKMTWLEKIRSKFLGWTKHQEKFDLLVKQLRTGEEIPPKAAKKMAEMRDLNLIVDLLTDPSNAVCKAALLAIGLLKNQHATYAVMALFPHPTLNHLIIDTLYELDDPRALEIIFKHGAYSHRYDTFLGKHKTIVTTETLLNKISSLETFDRSLVRALGKQGDSRAIEPLRKLLAKIQDIQDRRIILGSLVLLRDQEAFRPYFDLLYSEVSHPYMEVVENLFLSGDSNAIRLFIEFIKTPPANKHVVDETAEIILSHFGKLGEDGAEVLLLALQSPHPLIRYYALRRSYYRQNILGSERIISAVIPLLNDETLISDAQRVCDAAADQLKRIATPTALAAVKQWQERQNTF